MNKITITLTDESGNIRYDVHIQPDRKATPGYGRLSKDMSTIGVHMDDWKKINELQTSQEISDYMDTLQMVRRKS